MGLARDLMPSGLQAALLSTMMWFAMQFCLVVDIVLCLCLTNRDFQEGDVRAYGIVAIFQVRSKTFNN